ncbi:MAG: hypothetical protein Q7T11_06375 [Deltaproteobacteria bacterium]|nr:hypothetical protein [Deltaproteobacteria bacterium]
MPITISKGCVGAVIRSVSNVYAVWKVEEIRLPFNPVREKVHRKIHQMEILPRVWGKGAWDKNRIT